MPLTSMHLKRAIEDEEFARQWTNRLIKELNEAGHSWPELAEATGLTVAALRWRAGQMRGIRAVAEQHADTTDTVRGPSVEQQGQQEAKPTPPPPVALAGYMRGDRWRSLDLAGARALLGELDERQREFSVPSAPSTSAILTALTETSDQSKAHGFYHGGLVIVDEVVVSSRRTTRQLTEEFTLDGHTPTVERRGRESVIRWPSWRSSK